MLGADVPRGTPPARRDNGDGAAMMIPATVLTPLLDAIERCANRADVEDTSDGPRPNAWLRMQTALEDILAELQALP